LFVNKNFKEYKYIRRHLKDLPLARFRDYVRDVIHPPTSWADEPITPTPITQTSTNVLPVSNPGFTPNDEVKEMFRQLMDTMNVNNKKVDESNDKLASVTKDQKTLEIKHNLNAARTKEELDTLHNSQRRHLIMIRKMKNESQVLAGNNPKEKSISLLNILRNKIGLLPKIDIDPKVSSIYIINVPPNDSTFQDFRVTCHSQRDAIELRNRILNAKKAKLEPWSICEVSSDPVKSTRVRINLLQSVSRHERPTFNGEIMVNKYSDTPSIIYKRDNRVVKHLSFIDAMSTLGHTITETELAKAYQIVGKSYKGSLKEYFLVLNDKDSPAQSSQIPNTLDDGVVLTAQGSAMATAPGLSLGIALKRKLSGSNLDSSKKKK